MVNLVESYLNISILTQILDILRVGKNAMGVLRIEKNVRKVSIWCPFMQHIFDFF